MTLEEGRRWLDAFQARQRTREATAVQQRRDRERLTVRATKAIVAAHRQLREPVPIALLERRYRHIAADVLLPRDARDVAVWEQHVTSLLRRHAITAAFVVLADANGYAMAARRHVELPRIVNAETYVTALHEVGHCVRPCEATHARQKTDAGSSVCVRCELNAWQFAIRVAVPHWTRRMHASLAASLATYRSYAVGREVREVEAWIGPRGYGLAVLDREEGRG